MGLIPYPEQPFGPEYEARLVDIDAQGRARFGVHYRFGTHELAGSGTVVADGLTYIFQGVDMSAVGVRRRGLVAGEPAFLINNRVSTGNADRPLEVFSDNQFLDAQVSTCYEQNGLLAQAFVMLHLGSELGVVAEVPFLFIRGRDEVGGEIFGDALCEITDVSDEQNGRIVMEGTPARFELVEQHGWAGVWELDTDYVITTRLDENKLYITVDALVGSDGDRGLWEEWVVLIPFWVPVSHLLLQLGEIVEHMAERISAVAPVVESVTPTITVHMESE